jgi:hypothetical protein
MLEQLAPSANGPFIQDNRSTIMDDGFIRSHIGDLLRSLRTQYLIDLIKPYTRLELSFLAKVCDSTWLGWTTYHSRPS